MHIKKLSIVGYRCFSEGFEINFRKGLNVIVGENGSGKTTIIKLLNGLYDEYEGNILINGIEIRKINKKSLRNCLATLFQDYNKYQFTIKENIGFGSINNLDNYKEFVYHEG